MFYVITYCTVPSVMTGVRTECCRSTITLKIHTRKGAFAIGTLLLMLISKSSLITDDRYPSKSGNPKSTDKKARCLQTFGISLAGKEVRA